MMLADQGSWDRYCAAQWLNLRRWLDRNPDDELAPRYGPSSPASPHATRATRVSISLGSLALMKR
jgi:hypothetical protein